MKSRTIPLVVLANDNQCVTEILETSGNTTQLANKRIIVQNCFIAKQMNETREDPTFKVSENVMLFTKNASLEDRSVHVNIPSIL